MRSKNFENNGYNSRNSGKVFTGILILIGSLIGAAVGMLLAPTSGEKIRERIKDQAVDAQKKAKSVIEDAQDKSRELIENARDVSKDITDTVSKRKKSITKSF